MNFLDNALYYAEKGFAVLPLRPKDKRPATADGFKSATTDRAKICEWWNENPCYNIGIATGQMSGGLIVIDVDIKEEKNINGAESLAEWEAKNGNLPRTIEAMTGSGGWHYFYIADREVKSTANLMKGIDVRGDGGYIVAPPSIHPNGNKYEWFENPDKIQFAKADETVYKLLDSRGKTTEKPYKIAPEVCRFPEGTRVSSLVSEIGILRAKNIPPDDIKIFVSALNEEKCDPPLTSEELEREVFPAIHNLKEGNDTEREAREEALRECPNKTGKTRFNAFWEEVQQEITMIPTGFKNLDFYLDGGLFEGVYVIGAGSGMGKTTFAVQIADNIAKSGQPVVYFSLEMSAFELMAKSLSRITYEITIEKNLSESMAKDVRGITNIRLYQKYSELELDIIEEAKRRYMEFADNLFFHEGNFGSGVEELEVFVSAVKEYTGKTPVIIVDFFQILAPMREFRNCNRSDKQNADDNITALKRLSRDLKTPIVAISSLNRQNYETNAGLAAMKESGGIEYTCDVAMILQPCGVADADTKANIKEAYNKYKEEKRAKKLELKNEKNRKGRGYFKVTVFGNLKYNYFYEDKIFVDVSDDDSGCPFEMTQAEL